MTEFKITVEATALANAIENLARAISANGMGNTIAAVTASVPKVATTPVSTSAPAQQFVSAPTVPTATAPVVSVAAQVPVTVSAPVTAPGQQSANAALTPIPTAAPTYTLDMLAAAGSALIDAGKMNDLLGILSRYGVNALTELQPAVYGAVAAELRNLGEIYKEVAICVTKSRLEFPVQQKVASSEYRLRRKPFSQNYSALQDCLYLRSHHR